MDNEVRWFAASAAGADVDRHHPQRARLEEIGVNGQLRVTTESGDEIWCDWLYTSGMPAAPLEPGCELLVLTVRQGSPGICLGRIGRWSPKALVPDLVLESEGSVSLKCGDASLDLRADGKVMVKGEDVLIRAKGTQRIRAGNVAIN